MADFVQIFRVCVLRQARPLVFSYWQGVILPFDGGIFTDISLRCCLACICPHVKPHIVFAVSFVTPTLCQHLLFIATKD